MTVKQRVKLIKLSEKLDRSKDFAKELGLEVVFQKRGQKDDPLDHSKRNR